MQAKPLPQQLTVVTGNAGKALEIAEITGWPVVARKLEIMEVQSLDGAVVARAKAQAAYDLLKVPVVVDDSSLAIEVLGGLPGTLIAFFIARLGIEGILKLVGTAANRRAVVATHIGYCDGARVEVFSGVVAGRITDELRGAHGFGFDPLFIPEGQDKTLAEINTEEKNKASSRALALGQLKAFLAGIAAQK
jgi:XTP/dITP diphosphohydrolase